MWPSAEFFISLELTALGIQMQHFSILLEYLHKLLDSNLIMDPSLLTSDNYTHSKYCKPSPSPRPTYKPLLIALSGRSFDSFSIAGVGGHGSSQMARQKIELLSSPRQSWHYWTCVLTPCLVISYIGRVHIEWLSIFVPCSFIRFSSGWNWF